MKQTKTRTLCEISNYDLEGTLDEAISILQNYKGTYPDK